MTNSYCDALRIEVPALENVKDHPEANAYSLLIVALLERGDAMTLAEVAERFAAAGVAPVELALRSLQARARSGLPGRRPLRTRSSRPRDGPLGIQARSSSAEGAKTFGRSRRI